VNPDFVAVTTAEELLVVADAPARRLRFWSPWLLLFVAGWLVVFARAFPDPVLLASRNWPLIGVGFAGALLGNATAVGGGLVFVPVMTLVYGMAPLLSLKLALASQVFGMTSGAVAWAQRRMVPVEGLAPAIPGMLLGSLFGTFVVRPDSVLVKSVFGPISITIGVAILILLRHHGVRDRIPANAGLALFLAAVIGGMITGWVAIGQGEVIAAVLMLAFGLRTERSIGLGVVMLSLNSILLVLIHQFVWGDIPWEMAMFTGFGCVFGARMGPYLTQWIDQRKIKMVFAAVAIGDGLIFTFYALSSS